jgi:hypothetical protein
MFVVAPGMGESNLLIKGIDWNRIEKAGLYVSLILYATFQIISSAFPSFVRFFPDTISNLFLGSTLLLSIHYLIRLVEASNTKSIFKTHVTYTDAFQEWLEPVENIKELCVAAYTSHTFVEYLRLQPRKIKKVRLLLLYGDSPGTDDTEAAKALAAITLDMVLPRWRILVSDKKIGTFEARLVRSNASFYLGIADNQRVLFGLLWPRIGLGDLEPKEAFTLSSSSTPSRELVSYARRWFESVWEIATPLAQSTQQTTSVKKNKEGSLS